MQAKVAPTRLNFVRCDVRSGETAGKVTYKLGLYSYHIAINLQQIHSCHILLQLYVLSSFGHQHKSFYRSLLDKKQRSLNKVRLCGHSLMMNTGCISPVLQMDHLDWSINILKQSKTHLFMAVQDLKKKKQSA